jgi:single-strand DNA-binding protein
MKVYESQLAWNQHSETTKPVEEAKQDNPENKTNYTYQNLSFTLVEGFVTAKPNMVTTKSGKEVSHFSIATHYGLSKDTNYVSFLDVETWGKKAQACHQHLEKGSRVIVQGNLRQDRWENAKGEKKSHIKLVADSVTFLPKAAAKQN